MHIWKHTNVWNEGMQEKVLILSIQVLPLPHSPRQNWEKWEGKAQLFIWICNG